MPLMLRGFLVSHGLLATGFLVAFAVALPARAVTIKLDYTYDTTDFFGGGNPSGPAAGAQARAAVEAAANFYTSILTDTLSAVVIPPDYESQVFNGVAFWDAIVQFTNPSTGETVTLADQTRAVDEYRIYVGARDLGFTTLGFGGPYVAGFSQDYTGDGFLAEELDEINAITQVFQTAVETRGQEGFSAWGGVLTFDRVGTLWHYDHTSGPFSGTNDLYSVAIHELGHALGLGTADEWAALAAGTNFAGAASIAEYGNPPPLNPERDHWASNTMSTVFGADAPQEAALDPTLTVGTRKVLTDLDAAALVDIGWEVDAPTPDYHPADFNEDGQVNGADRVVWEQAFGPGAGADAEGDGDSDGADLLIWQQSLGAPPLVAAVPEPASAVLLVLSAGALCRGRGVRSSQRPRGPHSRTARA